MIIRGREWKIAESSRILKTEFLNKLLAKFNLLTPRPGSPWRSLKQLEAHTLVMENRRAVISLHSLRLRDQKALKNYNNKL